MTHPKLVSVTSRIPRFTTETPMNRSVSLNPSVITTQTVESTFAFMRRSLVARYRETETARNVPSADAQGAKVFMKRHVSWSGQDMKMRIIEELSITREWKEWPR